MLRSRLMSSSFVDMKRNPWTRVKGQKIRLIVKHWPVVKGGHPRTMRRSLRCVIKILSWRCQRAVWIFNEVLLNAAQICCVGKSSSSCFSIKTFRFWDAPSVRLLSYYFWSFELAFFLIVWTFSNSPFNRQLYRALSQFHFEARNFIMLPSELSEKNSVIKNTFMLKKLPWSPPTA